MLDMVRANWRAYQYVQKELLYDPDIWVAMAKQNGDSLKKGSVALRSNREVVLAAVMNRGLALRFANKMLRADRDVGYAAVTQDGMALRFCSEELAGDVMLVSRAVKQNGLALQYADDFCRLRSKAHALQAVAQNGLALEFTHEDLQDDHEVLSKAVAQNPYALQFASNEIQLGLFAGDRRRLKYTSEDVQRRVVEHDGMHLEFAHEELRCDEDFVCFALRQNPLSLKFASEELRVKLAWCFLSVVLEG